LIENYGCDYLTSSFSRSSIETKLKSFFSKSTLDGPKYNTYIFYYCGPSLKTLSNQFVWLEFAKAIYEGVVFYLQFSPFLDN
jgi:hypothetical protein